MPEIIPRDEWSREHWRPLVDIPLPAPEIWIHHGAGGSPDLATLRSYDRYHTVTKGWGALGYSFAITVDGIYEGRGWGKQGAHTKGRNRLSHGIVLVGDWTSKTVPQSMVDSLAWLVRLGQRVGAAPLTITGGHREAPGAFTACPGAGGMDAVARARRLLTLPNTNGEDGMPSADEVAEAVWNYRVNAGNDDNPKAKSALYWGFRHSRSAKQALRDLDVPTRDEFRRLVADADEVTADAVIDAIVARLSS